MKVAGILFIALLAAGCTLPNPPRVMALPPGGVELSGGQAAFQVYRFPIHGVSPVALAKINGFHHSLDDVAIAAADSSEVILEKNMGGGALFKEAGHFATCAQPTAIDGEDLTGDGFDDLLVTCPTQSKLSLLVGNGRGEFRRKDISVMANPISATSAPGTSQSGSPYLAVISETPALLELLIHRGGDLFERGPRLPIEGSPSKMVADQLTQDGVISYVVLDGDDSTFNVYLKRGDHFDRTEYSAPEAPADLATVDLRGTGLADIIVTSGTRNYFRYYKNDGTGHFTLSGEYRVPFGPASGIGVSHLRGTTSSEVYMQSSVTGDIIYYPVGVGGRLGEPQTIHAGSSLTGLITGHFFHTADDMDAAAIDTITNELVVLINKKPNFQ